MKRKYAMVLSLMFSALFASNAMAGTSKLVPARQTLENLGFVSQWDAETKTAEFKNDVYTVSVTAGSKYFEVNGKKVTFDSAVYDDLAYDTPVIINGSFYLPDEELAQAIGAEVVNGTIIYATPDNAADVEEQQLDYLVCVTPNTKLPDYWEDTVELVHVKNSLGDDVAAEKKAYDAYLKLKADLENDGIYVDLDSAYRSVAEQQAIVDDFTVTYGEDYVKQYVAVPGFSEHHTGLALDLYLNIDGKDVYLNEDMVEYPEIWAKIHEKLADYGFILRYLDGKDEITGYSYEPWHIRYVDSVDIAKEIAEKGETLEEYLGDAVLKK